MVFALRHLAPVVALATSVVADFSLFYVTTEGLGLPGTEPDAATFFWFNNPPDWCVSDIDPASEFHL